MTGPEYFLLEVQSQFTTSFKAQNIIFQLILTNAFACILATINVNRHKILMHNTVIAG